MSTDRIRGVRRRRAHPPGRRSGAAVATPPSGLSLQLVDALIGGFPLAVSIHDEDLVVRWANRAALAAYGGRPEAFVGRPITETYWPPAVDTHRFLLSGRWPEGVTYSALWQSRGPDANARHFRVHVFPFETDDGWTLVNVAQDVAEQIDVEKERLRLLERERRARAQADAAMRDAISRAEELRDTHALLAMQAELFRSTAQLVGDWVFVFDLSGRLMFVNDAVCGWLGRTADDLLGRPLGEILSGPTGATLVERGREVDETGRPQAFLQRMEVDGGPDGDFVCTIGTSDVDGRRIGLIGVAREIRDPALDRRALELVDAREHAARRQLDDAMRVLEMHRHRMTELDASKDEILALVSHDLRTPLTSVLGYGELLLRDAATLGERHTRYAETIVRNRERLMAHVDDIMLVAQHRAGAFTIRPQMVDLAEVVAHSVRTALPAADEAAVSITTQVPALTVVADPGRLGQLLDNLISNAVKYTQSGGFVLVAAEAGMHGVQVRISDNGPGIPVDEQRDIFDRFTRARDAAAGGVKGFGLGLAIARAIAEAHGGSIGVESLPGSGSTFWFTLPVTTTDAERADDER